MTTKKISTTDKFSDNQPLLIMTRPTPFLSFSDGWAFITLVFPDGRTSPFPYELKLEELFHPWCGNPPAQYHLKEYMNLKHPSSESILTCQKHSNHVMRKIYDHYSNPSKNLMTVGEVLREFCQRTSRNYEVHEYWVLVETYFDTMYSVNLNTDSSSSMFIHIGSQLDSVRNGGKLIKTGNEKRDKEIDSANNAGDKLSKHKHMLSTRFGLYKLAGELTHDLMDIFGRSDEWLKAYSLITEKYEEDLKFITEVENYRKRSKRDPRISVKDSSYKFILQQCLFCGEFYEIHGREKNNLSRYCHDPKCKKSHAAWVTKLRNTGGKTPDSVGLGLKKRRKP